MPATSVLDLIGKTPLVEITRLDTGPCRLFLKLESANPSGSIKDRPARAMIEAAERSGDLKEGGTVVEATAGNTGVGLALVASRKGYRTVLVVPDKMSREKILHARALGAEVIVTRSDVGKGHPDYYQDRAAALAAAIPGSFFADQFNNPANPRAHETGTGPEIWEQTGQEVDAIVVGVGSSGTLTGLTRYFRRVQPELAFVLADPVGSILAEYTRSGTIGEAGTWAVEGIGEDFIPAIADFTGVRVAYSIADEESFGTARELLRREGIAGGSSTGTLLAAALRYCRAQTAPKRVVSFVCDSGAKYLSKVFNDAFMAQEGWFGRAPTGTVRDVVINRFDEGSEIFVRPNETVASAFARMRAADVSQLPVIEGDRVVGLVEESDLLDALVAAGETMAEVFRTAVGEVMVSRLETIPADAPVAELLPLFRRGLVPLVMDGDKFLGLVTRIDLINHFRVRDR
jgi:cystathionine beta-synthase